MASKIHLQQYRHWLIPVCAVAAVGAVVLVVVLVVNGRNNSGSAATNSNTSPQSGQPAISRMEFRLYQTEETKNNVVSSTDVAKFGLYTSKFTVAISNPDMVSGVTLSLLDPQGKPVKDKDGNGVKFYLDDDGPTSGNSWQEDAVKGDGIFTSSATHELVSSDKWCSFAAGLYKYKLDVTVVKAKGLSDVSGVYPITINKNCE